MTTPHVTLVTFVPERSLSGQVAPDLYPIHHNEGRAS